MKFSIIDVNNLDIKPCFNNFMSSGKSIYSLTVNMDISKLIKVIDENNYIFYPTITWIISKSINNYKEFKMAYDEKKNIIYYNFVNGDPIVLNDRIKIKDKLCTIYSSKFKKFYNNMINELSPYNNLQIHKEEQSNLFADSSVHCVKYTSIKARNETEYQILLPMVTWGKYFKRGNKYLMPLTLQVHHTATDGYYYSLFYNDIEQILNNIEQILKNPEKYLN